MDLIRRIDNPESVPPEAPTRVPTRAEIRAVVTAHGQELLAAAERGELIEHVSLDQQDRVSAYVAALEAQHGELAAASFTQTWLEEMEAAVSATRRETQSLLLQAEADTAAATEAATQRAQADSEAAQWIVAALIVVVGIVAAAIFFA